jgi:diguanylate cyclase (GGDEF)-like protein/PAS domain S-box-containing protein
MAIHEQAADRRPAGPAPATVAAALELAEEGTALAHILGALAATLDLACDGLRISVSLADEDTGLSLVGEAAGLEPAHARWSTPIRSEAGRLLGAFTAFDDSPRASGGRSEPRSLRLIESAAQPARFAIERLRPAGAEADYQALVERIPAIVYIADAGSAGRWHYVGPQSQAILGFTPEECLADIELWAALIHPDDRERVLSQEMGAVKGTPMIMPIEYRMLHRDGRTVWIRDDAVLVGDKRGRLRWHGVMSDITERKHAETELVRRAAQQAAIARLGEHALEGDDLSSLMNEAVTETARSLEVEIGAIFELQSEEDSLLLRAGFNWPAEAIDTARVPTRRHSQAGFTLETGRAVVVSDWAEERRFKKSAVLSERGMRSGLTVVIEGRNAPWGVLGVQSAHTRDYSDADVNFVQALANVLADAIRRQSTEDDIRHRALHDPLTGLPNRVLFLDRVTHALARRDARIGVLFVDLDHFKLVNDTLGHAAGDALLVDVAPRLTGAVRPGDTIGRFGGDEFGILLEDISTERAAARIAERIAAAFVRPFILEGTEHFATASVGIAIASGDELPEELIRDADAAMYRAKDRGRARYELFDEQMRARTIARLSLENELRRALEREELDVVYQPVVSLRDGSIVSVEALLRWDHSQRGQIRPDEFIPVAEESGLIEPIGEWVLEQACRQGASWHAARPDAAPLGISVNLSARQLTQRDLPEIVARTIRRSGVQPMTLSLEITETVLLDETEAVDETLQALGAMGVRLVLDDFGTGYSSLSYLTRLPIDRLKIAREFVQGLGIEAREGAIITAVLGIAQALAIEVTAEGVETQLQFDELVRRGCDQGQGFYFSRAVSAAEVTAMLTALPPWTPQVTRGRIAG